MADLKNEFTWSVSRDSTFRECKRQYWWNYYGSWGGWSAQASKEAREAYLLKKLTNRWAWVGSVVHETIERTLGEIERAAARGAASQHPADLEALLEGVTARMRSEFSVSRDKRYRARPSQILGFVEHEYEQDVPKEEWAAMNRNALTALRTFFTSPLFREICESEPKRWLPIEKLEQFDFEGTPVWAVLDFATRRADGSVAIYDWKTGTVKPEANRPQLGCYTLYVQRAFDVQPDQVENHLVYLGATLQDFTFRLDAQELAEIRDKIRASVREMRGVLCEPSSNLVDKADCPMTEDRERCAGCSFRRLCER